MPVETATWVSELVPADPAGNQPGKQGDDHLRLIKGVLQSTFPNANKAFYFPRVAAKSANYTVLSTEENTAFLVDATSGGKSITLPTLVSGDHGWRVAVAKVDASVNAVTIVGTINGVVNLVLPTQYSFVEIVWTGTAWLIAEPLDPTPAGVILPFAGTTAPTGYLFAYGQEVSRTTYGALFSALGTVYGAGNGSTTFNLPDLRGRVPAGKDDMGGVSADRLTNQSGGLNGDTLGAAGGAETHTLTTAQLAAHSHTLTDPGHTHTSTNNARTLGGPGQLGGGGGTVGDPAIVTINSATTGITAASAGSGAAHNNVQPTFILNYIIKT